MDWTYLSYICFSQAPAPITCVLEGPGMVVRLIISTHLSSSYCCRYPPCQPVYWRGLVWLVRLIISTPLSLSYFLQAPILPTCVLAVPGMVVCDLAHQITSSTLSNQLAYEHRSRFTPVTAVWKPGPGCQLGTGFGQVSLH